MKFDKIFKNLKTENVIDLAKSQGLLSHAYLFLCSDEEFASNYSFHIAKKILGNCGACGKCHSCLMVDGLSHPDLVAFPKESGGKILAADVLEILEKAYLKPIESDNKVFILGNVINMNDVSQNKLLKVLEEPPQNTYFLLTATKLNGVLPTIQSRCVKLEIPDFSDDEIFDFLSDMEKDKEKLKLVSSSANGKITDAIKLLKSDKVSKQYDRAFNIIENLTGTKTLVKVLHNFEGVDDLEIFEFMQMIYRDMLMIKNQAENLVLMKGKQSKLKELSKNFSQMTLIESIDAVGRAESRQSNNVNKTSNIDTLLLELLEVKYNCQ
ncbi:MAG: DNA polymerase III subunit delta' C-terminal domain-containing protein [Clostridia bacterium]